MKTLPLQGVQLVGAHHEKRLAKKGERGFVRGALPAPRFSPIFFPRHFSRCASLNAWKRLMKTVSYAFKKDP